MFFFFRLVSVFQRALLFNNKDPVQHSIKVLISFSRKHKLSHFCSLLKYNVEKGRENGEKRKTGKEEKKRDKSRKTEKREEGTGWASKGREGKGREREIFVGHTRERYP